MSLQTEDVNRFTEIVGALTTEVRTIGERVKNLESNTAALNQSVAVLSDRSDRSLIIFDKLEKTLSASNSHKKNQESDGITISARMDWMKILKAIGIIMAIAFGGAASSRLSHLLTGL